MKQEEIHSLFNPSTERITKDADNQIGGIEYIIARQIIREHDENFGHIGCRIKAESTDEGYTIWFTLPSGRNNEE
jgi:light-regulated signal transduction histidine kinase (bacteriophytochrome)